jgi:hypothetical protein
MTSPVGCLAITLAALVACTTGPEPPTDVVAGTWGGENAGLIATDSTVHVHIGCTLGDVSGRLRLDAEGYFEGMGLYNVDAYPIDRGILHPARYTGRVIGRTMLLTVTLTDTTRVLGPVLLTYGQEPRMQVCPICRVPASARR